MDTAMLLAAVDWDSGILAVVKSGGQIAAVLVMVYAVMLGVKDAAGGKPGGAVKKILLGALVAAFLWTPALLETVLNTSEKVVETGLTTVDNIVPDDGAPITDGGSKD